jgi:hypothetical protein
MQSLELLVCARADFSLSIIRIVTFVQVKLLLLFANIHTASFSLSLRYQQTHNTTLFPRQKQDKAEHPLNGARTCSAVDLMELILIWRTDWKEVNQLISHNNSVRALVL